MGDVQGDVLAGGSQSNMVERIVESGESPRSNLRRFPGLANRYTPRRPYARRPAQEEVFGEPAVSPPGPMATTATTATATRLDSVGSRRREDERRKNGPMAEARQGLYPIVTLQHSSTTLYQVSYHIQ